MGSIADLTIRAATADDAVAVARIYNPYIADSCATFDMEPVSDHDVRVRMVQAIRTSMPWLVATTPKDGVVGYAYAAPWRSRRAYQYTVESSVYLDRSCTGQGIGRPLYQALLDAVRAGGMHAVIGVLALPNAASVALHERLGFRKVAHFEQVGYKFDRWVDVGYWQLLL